MFFRLPVVRFFNRVINRAMVTVALVLLQIGWLLWAFFSLTAGKVWVNAGLNVLSLFITLYLVRKDENSDYKIIWLVLIGMMPLLGGALYLAFGNKAPAKRMRQRMQAVERQHTADLAQQPGQTDALDPASRGLSRYVSEYGPYPAWKNSTAKYYPCGEAMYPDLLADLEKAERFIFLEFFIVRTGKMWKGVEDILVRKARAGVEVRLLYDAIGSWKLSERFVRRLRGAGIEVRAYAPLRFPWFSPRANRRNHSKIAVIDGRTGFVGGINIAERYLDGDALGRWRDEHLRIEGEAVDDLQRLFAADWALEGGEPLSEGLYAAAPADDLPCSPLQIAWTREDRSRTTLTDLFAQLIEEARHTLRISSPYFLPPPALYEALLRAVRRGCRVLVMLPARSDVWLARRATDAYLGELLGAGVEIFRFRGGFLHAKRLIADERVASVGTANFDYRSLEYNTEATALLLDSATVRQAIRRFDEDLASCTPIDPEAWRRRSVHYRLGDRIARLFAPLL